MSFLKVVNLSQSFGNKSVLNAVSFSIEKGTLAAFLGPNGAGKTTLLRTMMGLLPLRGVDEVPSCGIFLGTECLNDWPVAKRVEQGILYLPQQSSLFLQLTVFENLKLVFEHHSFWQKPELENDQRQPLSESKKRVLFEEEMYRFLRKAHLSNVLGRQAGVLSGGQRRKVEIVRSLLMHPTIIMLDEPFAGVDPKSIYELKEIFLDLTKRGITVLISDHHVDQLFSIAQHIYVIIHGEIVTSGTIEDVMHHNYTKNTYFGGEFYAEMKKRFLK